jgi:hypothetical protein
MGREMEMQARDWHITCFSDVTDPASLQNDVCRFTRKAEAMTDRRLNKAAQGGGGETHPQNRRQRDVQGDMQNAADDTSRWRERTGEEVEDSTDTLHDRSREQVESSKQPGDAEAVRRNP